MGALLFIVAVLIAAVYLYLKKYYRFWSDRGFASAPSSFPFGSLKGVGTKFHKSVGLDIIYKKYKGKVPVVGIFSLFKPAVLLLDPELYKCILVKDFATFQDRGFYYDKQSDPLTANLLTLEGQEWKDRRVKLSPIFTSGKMKMMFETVNAIGDKLIDIIQKKVDVSSTLEMRELSGKFTADVIGNVAFGLECKCLEDPNSEFYKQGRRLFDLSAFEVLRFFFALGFPNFCRKFHIRMNPKEPMDFFLNTFLQTLEHREKSKVERNDFVSMLLALKDSFTPTELAAESFVVYAGGFETSSTLVTFTLYELALNPDIQERLRDEIRQMLQDNNGILSYEQLLSAKYLSQIINESLRKYPPIPTGIRKCLKDYKIPGTDLIIPQGSTVQMAAYSLHNDPEYFPDPQKYDPERFGPENVKNHIPFTFMPFGEGPHNCIGMRFGLMQSKIALVKLLQNFEFSPCDKTTIPMKFVAATPFLSPAGGMWLNLKKIKL